jgi:hypothetical protein
MHTCIVLLVVLVDDDVDEVDDDVEVDVDAEVDVADEVDAPVDVDAFKGEPPPPFSPSVPPVGSVHANARKLRSPRENEG